MSSNQKSSINWHRIVGTIGIAFSLILCAAIIWYLVRIEAPSTARVQSDILNQDTDLSDLLKNVSSTPMHSKITP